MILDAPISMVCPHNAMHDAAHRLDSQAHPLQSVMIKDFRHADTMLPNIISLNALHGTMDLSHFVLDLTSLNDLILVYQQHYRLGGIIFKRGSHFNGEIIHSVGQGAAHNFFYFYDDNWNRGQAHIVGDHAGDSMKRDFTNVSWRNLCAFVLYKVLPIPATIAPPHVPPLPPAAAAAIPPSLHVSSASSDMETENTLCVDVSYHGPARATPPPPIALPSVPPPTALPSVPPPLLDAAAAVIPVALHASCTSSDMETENISFADFSDHGSAPTAAPRSVPARPVAPPPMPHPDDMNL
jgi:hypothetical protein